MLYSRENYVIDIEKDMRYFYEILYKDNIMNFRNLYYVVDIFSYQQNDSMNIMFNKSVKSIPPPET